MIDRLTEKQRLFIAEYTTNGFNATGAARKAGYSGNDKSLPVTGVQVLKSSKVKAEISRILAERGNENEDKAAKCLLFLENTIDGKGISVANKLRATELYMKTLGMLKEHRIIEDATRERELDEAQKAEALRIAAIRFRQTG